MINRKNNLSGLRPPIVLPGILSVLICLLLLPSGVLAQHPVEVERQAASAEYFQSLVTFDKLPQRRTTTSAILAAARSAWGLSLPERAGEELEAALRDPNLDSTERGRIHLTRGIIEFQEGRWQVAALYAQKAAEAATESETLRSRSMLLWAEALSELQSFGLADEKYKAAAEAAAVEDQPEIAFGHGSALYALGRYDEARLAFERVPLGHERTADAIKSLARIALETGRTASAEFWLNKGRADFPDRFLDSWVDYALLKVAIDQKDQSKVKSIRDAAAGRYPPSDFWVSLMNAAAEAFEWEQTHQG